MHLCYDSLYHLVHLVEEKLTGLLQMKVQPPLSDAANFRPQSWHDQVLSFSAKRLSFSQEEVSFGFGFRMKCCMLCVGSLFQKGCRVMHKPDSSLKLILLSEELK
jgi:hypothetical protein